MSAYFQLGIDTRYVVAVFQLITKVDMIISATCAGLSRPFRRLQQYPSLLQEMYRHLPEAHRDRGDTHRAAKVMTDFAVSGQANFEVPVCLRQHFCIKYSCICSGVFLLLLRILFVGYSG